MAYCFLFLRSGGERDRNLKARLGPHSNAQRAATLLAWPIGYQGEPFRLSQPQNKLRPPRGHTPRLSASQKRVFRCGVNQTSAKYHLGSVPQPSCTSGRSVGFNNPGTFDLWKSSLAREQQRSTLRTTRWPTLCEWKSTHGYYHFTDSR
jgi:hypothetical protein